MNAARRTSTVAFVTFVLALAALRIPAAWVAPLPVGWKNAAIKVVLWIPLCLFALWLAHRTRPRAAYTELGLAASARRGIAFGFVSSLPMVALFAVGRPTFDGAIIVKSVLVSAFTEELLFRGYLFRQLHRRAGWRFGTAVLATALVFGLGHAANVRVPDVGLIAAEVAITALGGAFFAWVFVRCGDNLWAPISLHAFMNLWWEVSGIESMTDAAQAGATAVGTWLPNAARVATIVLAVVLARRQRV
jgi:membrane protease YdiL (CAAX protease family)